MISKKQIYRWHKKLHFVAPKYIFIVAILFTSMTGFALRHNYTRALELKKAVETADKDNADIEGSLRALRRHVYTHMNANLSTAHSIQHPVQLKHQYDMLIATENEKAKQANISVNQKAVTECEAQHPGGTYNQAKVTCIQEYVAANAVKPRDIPTEFYQFDFVSPRWSPDFAGLSLVAAGMLWILWICIVFTDKLLVKSMKSRL